MKILLLLLPISILFFSCQEKPLEEEKGNLTFTLLPNASKEGGEPNLFAAQNGKIYLSWVEYLNDSTDALLFSTLENNTWTEPKMISSGSDWFVNWADFPSMVVSQENQNYLVAHWLQKSAGGTYDYDVRIAQSFDAGDTWQASFMPHRDRVAAEHGFVSLLSLPQNLTFATWLDGRNTKSESHESDGHGHHGNGAMTLRSAVFDQSGNLNQESELDTRICDCCQTSAALTSHGVIVAYRDRSEDEIRDIYTVRQVSEKWTRPKAVYADNWKISGCPVNGPSIKALDDTVVVAWYTEAEKTPQVKVSFSNDYGTTFGAPIRVDDGKPLGRVGVELLSANEALVSWLEKTAEGAVIKVRKVSSTATLGNSFAVTTADASRQSGFPRMVKNGTQLIFAWTEVDSLTKVRTAIADLGK